MDELEAKARLAAVEWNYGEGNATDALLEEATESEVAFFLKLLRSARADGKREGMEEAAKVADGFGITGLVVAERIRALKDTNG